MFLRIDITPLETYEFAQANAGTEGEDNAEGRQFCRTALGNTSFDTYGRKYLMQMTMQDMVISYLMENVTIQ